MPEKTADQRVHAAWRSRACAASFACGASVFAFGAGIAMPLSLNAVWLSALPCVPLCALAAARCVVLSRRIQAGGGMRKWRAALLAAVMLASCAFLTASLVSLAGYTLLEQARAVSCALLTVGFLLAAAAPRMQGVSRLCFAVRFVLPAAMLLCGLAFLPQRDSPGLYPLLGPGAGPVLAGTAAMLSCAAPALMLLLPLTSSRVSDAPTPPIMLFAGRAAAGAALGTALLLLYALPGGYEAMRARSVWGERLTFPLSGGAQQPLIRMLMLLLQLFALQLGAVSLLCAAEDALCLALPALRKHRAGLLLCAAALAALMLLLTHAGYTAALIAAPLIALPAALTLLPALSPRGAGKEACG
ncbi:MAG: hypothetical protein J6K32_04760 [Clostridia bacterium]|nr:hypothetical protein [Clostridia bacterium]